MEYFAVAEVIDPQEAKEISITIVKLTKIIYGYIIIRIEMAQTKKADPSSETLCNDFGVCKKCKGITTQGYFSAEVRCREFRIWHE
jgi:hypothetical protein